MNNQFNKEMETLQYQKAAFRKSHELRMKELNEAIDSLDKTSNEFNTRINKINETIDRFLEELKNM